mgnify:CR=1 FL=1
MRIVKLNAETKKDLLKNLLKRSPSNFGNYAETVQEIVDDVRDNGDAALFSYTKKFDKADITAENVKVTQEEIDYAYTQVSPELLDVIRKAKKNIWEYHEKQKQYSWFDSKPNGTLLGQKVTALASVGVYVPGGKAAYPSSVLMNIMPAKVAGVDEIIMVTPPLKDGTANKDILVAAALCGVDKIYLAGGAQAVAALAYGTEEIPRVSKIVGPGNIFVATAKKLLYGTVDIDMFAGPSEILVFADETANPVYLAADLMSQAEHDKLASAIMITTSMDIAVRTQAEIERQSAYLSRKDIIDYSMTNYGAIIVSEDKDYAIELANKLAPEHMEVVADNPTEYIGKIDNVGSLFLGQYSPEPLGDYYAGPNHVLPTSGTARFFSPLGVDSFVKRSSYICYTKDALLDAADDIILIAEREKLTAHANSIKVRKEG